MIVTVLLFASAADLVGKRNVQIDLSDGSTVSDLSHRLATQYPALQALLKISRWAVDRQFVTEQTTVAPEQEIALIPPVSGG